jgi:hypothetical protein
MICLLSGIFVFLVPISEDIRQIREKFMVNVLTIIKKVNSGK